MMNTEQTKPFVYFSNDTCAIVAGYVDEFRSESTEMLETNPWMKEPLFDFMIQDLRSYVHSYKKQCQKVLAAMDILNVEEDDHYGELVAAFSKDKNAFERLVSAYEDLLYKDRDFLDDCLSLDKTYGNDMLKEDGFIGGTKEYIILGYNMGWRHRNGAKVTTISSIDEMVEAVTGNYDYTIKLKRETSESPFITATVFSHDAPTGASYYLIPVMNLQKALKNDIIRDLYDGFRSYFKEELETA